MIISSCLCRAGKNSTFEKHIEYKSERVFKHFEGIVIGKCSNCGILKTITPKSGIKFNPKQSRGEFYDVNKEKFVELFKPIVQLVKQYVDSGSVLDVGCSSGILLSLLQDEGFNVTGIEPNKAAFEKARKRLGYKAFRGTLKDFIKRKRVKFDCIIYNHVLEHIADPIGEIKLAKKILKKTGVLIIGTPNTNNIIFYLRQKYWEPFMPNEHIWHFHSKYLINLFKKLNFEVADKLFFDDMRKDYPLIKRIYFSTLSTLNKIFNTGEATLLVFK